jgi:DNA-directed RNA polymerase subunit RPC12/RpoP
MSNSNIRLGKIKLDGYKCERCDHTWLPRIHEDDDDLPVICPKCKSPYWNKPRKSKHQK